VLNSFSGYNGTNALTGGFLHLSASTSGTDTLVQVDNDGSLGGNSFTMPAVLTNSLMLETDTNNYLA
jgi:hypothetical protein